MKNLNILGLLFLFGLFSCDPDIPDVTANRSELDITNPYIQVETSNIPFQGGIPSYNVVFNVINSDNIYKLSAVNMYGVFTNAATGDVSDRYLFKEFAIGGDAKTHVSEDYTYEDLRAGLSLPADPFELEVGSGWKFDFEGIQSDGKVVELSGNVRIAVQGRLAGAYTITTGIYVHPTAGASSHAGAYTRFVESVDPVYYRMVEIGPWDGQGNSFVFTVNDDNSITIPKEYNGSTQLIWGADDIATCQDDPGKLSAVSCDNKVEFMSDGKDVIRISYGYIRTSGTRQFDEVLTKQ